MDFTAQVEELRGAPLNVGNLEEIIDEKCAPASCCAVKSQHYPP